MSFQSEVNHFGMMCYSTLNMLLLENKINGNIGINYFHIKVPSQKKII